MKIGGLNVNGLKKRICSVNKTLINMRQKESYVRKLGRETLILKEDTNTLKLAW